MEAEHDPPTAACPVIDFMVPGVPEPTIVRIVEGLTVGERQGRNGPTAHLTRAAEGAPEPASNA